MEKKFADIDTALRHGKGSTVNLCYAYIEIILKEDGDQQHQILRYLLENYDQAESNEEVEIDTIISANEEKILKGHYASIANEILASLVNQNLPDEEFYANLWVAINSPVFKDTKAKAIALQEIITDKRIPYFFTPDDGRKMSNAEFRKIKESIYQSVAKVRFILIRDFSQRTEQADFLLRELDKFEGDERIVLMATLVNEAAGSLKKLELLSKLVGEGS